MTATQASFQQPVRAKMHTLTLQIQKIIFYVNIVGIIEDYFRIDMSLEINNSYLSFGLKLFYSGSETEHCTATTATNFICMTIFGTGSLYAFSSQGKKKSELLRVLFKIPLPPNVNDLMLISFVDPKINRH